MERNTDNARSSHGWSTVRTLDDAASLCGSALYPQQDIGVLGDSRSFSLTQRLASLGPVTVGEIEFGSAVWMDCGSDRTTYHINVPLSGCLDSVHRGRRTIAGPGVAAVYRPQGETAIARWDGGGRTLFAKIDRSVVDDALADSLRRQQISQISFEAEMPTTAGLGRSWLELLMVINKQLSQPDSLIHQPLVALPLIDSLVRGLLVAADHPERATVVRGTGRVGHRTIHRVIDIIEAEADSPLTVSYLARRGNVSVRTLQDAFRADLDTTPMAYVRSVRLRRAREVLLESDPSVATVASVAHRWGFTHLGRFASAYSAHYGEKPADTLRRNTFYGRS